MQGTSVISPVIPLLTVVLSAFIISQKSVDRVFETYPSLYIITFGMVAAKVTNKLVVSLENCINELYLNIFYCILHCIVFYSHEKVFWFGLH